MDHVLPDGTVIPLGKGVPTDHKNTSLLYNEYPFRLFHFLFIVTFLLHRVKYLPSRNLVRFPILGFPVSRWKQF